MGFLDSVGTFVTQNADGLSVIGAGLGVAGGIAGAFGAANAMRKYDDSVNRMAADNENWFNKEYNSDYTQRADAQRMLTQVKDFAKNRVRQAEGQAAISGATPEAEALAKKDASDAVADATGNIAAAGAQYKQGVMDKYLTQKSNLDQLKAQGYMNRAAAYGQAGSNALGFGGDLLGGFLKKGK